MHDEPQLIDPDQSPFAEAPPVDSGDGPGRLPEARDPAVRFAGPTFGRGPAVRAGLIVGTALVVVIGAAVAMGASPSPSGSAGSGSGGTPQGGTPGTGPGNRGFQVPGDLDGGPGKHGKRGFGQITVSAIQGSSVSLKTEDGWTRTIEVTSSTTITKGGQAATLADLKVGDAIAFGQTRNSDGTYTINRIAILIPSVAGTVTAIDGDSITISGRDGTSQTIKTTGSTTYRLGKANGSRSDVKVGSMIVAGGEKASDGTLTATSVVIRLPEVAGTVTAKTADTITISRRDGTTLTIHVGSATTFEVAGKSSASLSDVTVGMVVEAAGTKRGDGSIDALDVHAGVKGDHFKGAPFNQKPAPSATPSGSTG